MDLRAYLDRLPRGGVAEFADRIGISDVYLSQLAAKQDGRQPSVPLTLRIEAETNGKVTRYELRNDATTIWPKPEKARAA